MSYITERKDRQRSEHVLGLIPPISTLIAFFTPSHCLSFTFNRLLPSFWVRSTSSLAWIFAECGPGAAEVGRGDTCSSSMTIDRVEGDWPVAEWAEWIDVVDCDFVAVREGFFPPAPGLRVWKDRVGWG
jgi:hypothetical protein